MGGFNLDLTKYNIDRIPRPFESQSIAAGGSTILYNLKLGKHQTAFITHLANVWFTNTYSELKFDYELYNDEKIEYSLGSLNSPHKEEPPIIVTDQITWEFFNNHTTALTFDCLVEGVIVNGRKG